MLDWLIEFVNTHFVKFIFGAILALVVLFVGLKLVKLFTTRLKSHKLFQNMDSNIGTLILTSCAFY